MSASFRVDGVTQMMTDFREAASRIPSDLMRQAEEAATYVEDEMISNAKEVSGQLRSSISHDVAIIGGVVRAVIGPEDSSLGGRFAGAAIESGRHPGRRPPPPGVLAMRYGINIALAKRAAMTIAQRGTVGLNFVGKTYEKVKGQLAGFADKVIYVAAKTMAGA